MNETAVAKSYMNHEKPQSSKSITRTVAAVDQHVGEAQVGVHEPERLWALAEGAQPRGDRRVEALQLPALLRRPCPARPATRPSGRAGRSCARSPSAGA